MRLIREWTELWQLRDINADSAQTLRNLPGLLSIDTRSCRDVSFLPALSQLQWLRLQIDAKPWVTGEAVAEAMSECRYLTFLELMAPVTSAHLSALLPQLPLLRTLSLGFCCELDSLRFLSDVPALQHNLRVFVLHHPPPLPSSEIRHVFGLRSLDTLRLSDLFSEPLDGFTRRLLTPPSTVLPTLTAFECKWVTVAVA